MGVCVGPHQATAAAGEINHPLLDPISLIHGGVGLAMGLFGLGLAPTLAIAVGWEVVEHILKDCVPGAFVYPTQDTVVNAVGDVLASLVGWRLARHIEPATRSTPSATNSSVR